MSAIISLLFMVLNYIYSFNFEVSFFFLLLFLLLQRTCWTIIGLNVNFQKLTLNTIKILIYFLELFFIIFICKAYFYSIVSDFVFIELHDCLNLFKSTSLHKFFLLYYYVIGMTNFIAYKQICFFLYYITLTIVWLNFLLGYQLFLTLKTFSLYLYIFVNNWFKLLIIIYNYIDARIFLWLSLYENFPNFSFNFIDNFFTNQAYNYKLFEYSYINFYNKYIILSFILIYYIIIWIYYKIPQLSKLRKMRYNYLFTYEFPILIGFLFFGYTLVVTTTNLFIVYLGFEIQTFTILILSGQLRQFYSVVITSLKYFFYSFLSSLFFLLGILYLYNFGFSLNYYELYFTLMYNLEDSINSLFISSGIILLLLSFFFKLGVFPFYLWVLDIFEGFPRLITLLLLTLNKFNLYIFLVKFLIIISHFNFYLFNLIIHILTFSSLMSLFFGSFLALTQTNIHRFFGATSITHMGLLLLFIKISLILNNNNSFYLIYSYFILYMSLTFVFFGVLIIWNSLLNNQISLVTNKKSIIINFNFNFIKDISWFNLFSKKTLLTLALLLLNLSGFPPFSFFFIKFNLLLLLADNFLYLDTIAILYFSTLITGSYIRLISIFWIENITSNFRSLIFLKYFYQLQNSKNDNIMLKIFIVVFEYFILGLTLYLLFYNYILIFLF